MKKKPTTPAPESATGNQLATIATGFKPRLSKQEILAATALALFREEQTARDAAHKAIDAAIKVHEKLALHLFRKHWRRLDPIVSRDQGYSDTNFDSVTLRLNHSEYPELAAALKEVNRIKREMPAYRSLPDITRELRAAAATPSRIESLLSDVALSTRLAQAGKAILKAPSPMAIQGDGVPEAISA